MAIAIGKQAPAFTLPSSEGGTVALADLAGRPAVIYFYPKDLTGGCAMQAEAFRDAMPALAKLGAALFGVSKDSIATHCKFRDKYALTFPLLSDETGEVLTAYGAWGEKTMYGKKRMGIIRSTVLLDGEGTVVRHWPKVRVKGHTDEVLAAVRALVEGDADLAKPKRPAKSRAGTARTAKARAH